MQNYSQAEPLGISKSRTHEIAGEIAIALGYRPGVDIEPLINRTGGRVNWVNSAAEFDDTVDGSIKVHGAKDYDIFVADSAGPLRARFTIAHELGHYALHYREKVGPMRAERFGSGRVEWEANWFAAGFLMPEPMFRAVHEEQGGYLADIASSFRVSLEAARLRAENLKLEFI